MKAWRSLLASGRQWRRAQAAPRLDFLAPASRTPILVWAAAAAGALLLALGVNDSLVLRQHIAEEMQRAETSRGVSTAGPRVAAAAPVASAVYGAEASREARRLAAQARHPWGELFAAVEAAGAGGVQWLALEHASDRPELRLEGIAGDSATALRTVDTLATRSGFSRAVLTRLGSVDPQGPGLRFEISARVGAIEGGGDVSEGSGP